MAKRGRGRPKGSKSIPPPKGDEKAASSKGLKKLVFHPLEKKHEFYALVRDLIEKHHPELEEAKIIIGWRMNWREDTDGNIRLSQLVKANELSKELANFDYVFLINHEFANSNRCTPEHTAYLFDDLLCRCAPAEGKNGDQKEDERNRPVWRTRKPEFSGFVGCVARHGPVLQELVALARELKAHDQMILPFESEVAGKQPAASA